MATTLPPITLLEPLSLLGRELLQVLEERDAAPERLYTYHLQDDEEHQLAEITGEAGLVAPLTDDEALPAGSVVIIAGTPSPSRRAILEQALASDESLAVLDLAGTGLIEAPVLTGPPEGKLWPPRAAVGAPGTVAVAWLAAPLLDLGLEGIWAAVEVPASAGGREAVEALARQAVARLQGEPAAAEQGGPAAFDVVPAPGRRVQSEIAGLFPGGGTAVTTVLAGVFHGWTVHLGLRFREPVREEIVLARWEASGAVVMEGPALRLSSVVESERLHVGPLELSAGGRQLAVTACADGLRVGGVATALEILPALV